MTTHDFVGFVALDAASAFIPARNSTFYIEQEYRVVLDALDQELIALSDLLQRVPFGDIPRQHQVQVRPQRLRRVLEPSWLSVPPPHTDVEHSRLAAREPAFDLRLLLSPGEPE